VAQARAGQLVVSIFNPVDKSDRTSGFDPERIANLKIHIERMSFSSDWSGVRREDYRAEIAL
jgi:hypothetical protein